MARPYRFDVEWAIHVESITNFLCASVPLWRNCGDGFAIVELLNRFGITP